MGRNVQIQILRGVLANRPALAAGEFYFATDTQELYLGTGAGALKINGGSSGLNVSQAVVDFGTPVSPATEDTTASVTVAAAWVTASSKLICTLVEGQDHTADEIAAEQVTASVGNIKAGVSVDVWLSAPNGARGKFLVNVEG